MKLKVKILVVFALIGFSLSVMSNTYSRYIADTTGDVEMVFAKWQILVNNSDITSKESSEIDITPTIIENENVALNKLAPSSKGYFDIEIDPSTVEVSFNYKLNILENEDMPDLIISRYTIIDDETDLENINYLDIVDNQINGTFNYQKNNEAKPFTIRVYFEWYDGIDNTMDDSTDTDFVSNNESISIKANISFEQKI